MGLIYVINIKHTYVFLGTNMPAVYTLCRAANERGTKEQALSLSLTLFLSPAHYLF